MKSAASLRSRIAGASPEVLRRGVRMVEHYGRRYREWTNVLLEMRGVATRDRLTLFVSALVAPLTSLRRLDGFEPPLFLRDVDLQVRGVGRFSIRAGTDDIIHVLTAREPKIREIIEQLLRPGDIFVDAGANIGFYSILAHRKISPTGRVFAVEMMPETAGRLRYHVAINQAATVTVIENALSDVDNDVIVATSSSSKFGQATIVALHARQPRSIRRDVCTVRLDTALADIGPIRLIKMDVEGAEFLALSGATAVLERTEAVLFESLTGDQNVMELLVAAGFAVRSLTGRDYLAVREQTGGTRI